MAAALAGREEELLAQLRALLFLPAAASPAPPWTPAPPAVKAESAAGLPLAAIVARTTTGGGRGSGHAAAASSATATSADASSCGGAGRRRRQGQGSKRDRDDDSSDAKDDEQHDEAPAAADARPQHYPPRCKRRCVRGPWLQQYSSSSSDPRPSSRHAARMDPRPRPPALMILMTRLFHLQEEEATEQFDCDVSARFRWVPVEEVRAEADRRCHVPQVIILILYY